MDLSVIIVNYRGWKKLKECLDSLASFASVSFSFEVIVADNNSDDGRLAEFSVAYPAFRFISNPVNGGFAYGCNRGVSVSSGKYLLFLNPDTVAGETAVSALYAKAEAMTGNFLMSCRQVDEKGGESIAWGEFVAPGKLTGTGRALNRLLKSILRGRPVKNKVNPLTPDWISGSVVLAARDFFLSLGGFDEDFWMYYEDMDLCKRARGAGASVLYFTDFSIRHMHGGSTRINTSIAALTKTEVRISRHLYISKHFSGFNRLTSQVILVAGNLISGLAELLAGCLLFFIPKARVRVLMFFRLTAYYCSALIKHSWISPRSVNSKPLTWR
jgi:GT2 family glycosyltransferase